MTADEINRSFPNIADWIQGSGSIEIGNQEWQGFVVRALGEGGVVIEVEQCKSLGAAPSDPRRNRLSLPLRMYPTFMEDFKKKRKSQDNLMPSN
jgi:hypothetical protein